MATKQKKLTPRYIGVIALLAALTGGCSPDYGDLEGYPCYTKTCGKGLVCCRGICYKQCPDGSVSDMGMDGLTPDRGPDKGSDAPIPDKGMDMPVADAADMGADAKSDGSPDVSDAGYPDITPDKGVPDASPCSPPCVNGGQCAPKAAPDGGTGDAGMDAGTAKDSGAPAWVCQCLAGYAGDWCQTCAKGYIYKYPACVKDPCDPNPCQNGGTCQVSSASKAECTCAGNWNPVFHCTTCNKAFTGSTCTACAEGYGGVNCAVEVNCIVDCSSTAGCKSLNPAPYPVKCSWKNAASWKAVIVPSPGPGGGTGTPGSLDYYAGILPASSPGVDQLLCNYTIGQELSGDYRVYIAITVDDGKGGKATAKPPVIYK